jgi:23S rRNA pseudouridine2605 synthase
MHPRNEIEKCYVAVLQHEPSEEQMKTFRKGVLIEGKLTAPAEIKKITHNEVKIKIREGRNRQVRKMCEAIGCPVISLKRVAIGGVSLGSLPVGKWRNLSESEVELCLRNSKKF